MTAPLERRYAALLRVYPHAYRQQRGDEILGTLLARATPGQTRPPWRESVSLLFGGLRARAGAARAPRELTLSILKMAALFQLLWATAVAAGVALRVQLGVAVMDFFDAESYIAEFTPDALALACYGGAMVAIARNRYALGAVLAVAGYIPQITLFSPMPLAEQVFAGDLWQVPIAVLLALTLHRFRYPDTASPWRWLAAVPAGVVITGYAAAITAVVLLERRRIRL
jgi:hypothetical protein